MTDQIVLLEERKEITTFLLDDGDITSDKTDAFKVGEELM